MKAHSMTVSSTLQRHLYVRIRLRTPVLACAPAILLHSPTEILHGAKSLYRGARLWRLIIGRNPDGIRSVGSLSRLCTSRCQAERRDLMELDYEVCSVSFRKTEKDRLVDRELSRSMVGAFSGFIALAICIIYEMHAFYTQFMVHTKSLYSVDINHFRKHIFTSGRRSIFNLLYLYCNEVCQNVPVTLGHLVLVRRHVCQWH